MFTRNHRQPYVWPALLVILLSAVALPAATFTFVEGGTTPILGGTYTGAEDANLLSGFANENVGQRADMEVANNGSGTVIREIMRWDLSALSGYTVSTASFDLKVKQVRAGALANTISAYQVFPTDWVEGIGSGVTGTPSADDRGVTWNRRNQTNHSPLTGTLWNAGGLQAGTDRGTTVLGSYSVVGATGGETVGQIKTFAFTPAGAAVLTGWANGSSNGGMLLQASNEATPAVIFHSSQAVAQADRPVLTINAFKPLASVPAGLELWLDAADTATVTASGSNVTGWLDKSPKARTAAWTPYTGGVQPTYALSSIAGLPAVRFNRGDLTIAGGLDIAAEQQRTIFAVLSYSTLTNNSEIMGSATSAMIDVGTYSQSQRLRLRDAAHSGDAYSGANSLPTGANIVAVQSLAASTLAWRNGAPLSIAAGKYMHYDMGVGAGVNFFVGGSSFSGREFIGDLAEVLVFDRALSAGDLNDVGIYLQEKYSLAGSYLPNTPPVPVPGGPYTIIEGKIITLDASASSDTDYDLLTQFAWDLDNDGQFDDLVSTGPTASVSFDDLLGLGLSVGANPIALRVTDDDGMSATLATTLTLEVPEPATLSLLGLTLAGLGRYIRRRKQAFVVTP